MLFLHFPWSLDYPNSLESFCRVWKLILLCAVFDKYEFLQLNYAIELQRLWNEIFLLAGKTFYISSNYKMILHTLMRSVCVPPNWLQVASGKLQPSLDEQFTTISGEWAMRWSAALELHGNQISKWVLLSHPTHQIQLPPPSFTSCLQHPCRTLGGPLQVSTFLDH